MGSLQPRGICCRVQSYAEPDSGRGCIKRCASTWNVPTCMSCLCCQRMLTCRSPGALLISRVELKLALGAATKGYQAGGCPGALCGWGWRLVACDAPSAACRHTCACQVMRHDPGLDTGCATAPRACPGACACCGVLLCSPLRRGASLRDSDLCHGQTRAVRASLAAQVHGAAAGSASFSGHSCITSFLHMAMLRRQQAPNLPLHQHPGDVPAAPVISTLKVTSWRRL